MTFVLKELWTSSLFSLFMFQLIFTWIVKLEFMLRFGFFFQSFKSLFTYWIICNLTWMVLFLSMLWTCIYMYIHWLCLCDWVLFVFATKWAVLLNDIVLYRIRLFTNGWLFLFMLTDSFRHSSIVIPSSVLWWQASSQDIFINWCNQCN